ncbi:DKNYY domain-containing protein [Taibaiella koreensis]|uniref:DKNYY domain-containing protein n=1 Tax=Taibaiella koreensis TaxID=1268548 RepID=UPI000E59B207|nr:DKNYY domain-containing protein [Taibaiella koreensis]
MLIFKYENKKKDKIMRLTIYTSIILFLSFTGCYGQTKYFEVTDIIDKTEELAKKVEWTLLKDKERIDGYTRVGDSIFGGEIACNISPIKNADAPTFAVYPGSKYARDKNRVYYPILVKCVDYEDCGVCYYEKVIVEKANPSNFQYLGKDYARDNQHAYFRGQLIKGADGNTFKLVEGPEYLYFATDKNSVYSHNKVFEDADPSTFYYKKDSRGNNPSEADSKYIIGDKNTKWEHIPPDQIKKL